jgi:hypothetical protein
VSMSSGEYAKTGAEATSGVSSRKNSDVSLPAERGRRSSGIDEDVLSRTLHTEDSEEEDTQSGAQEIAISSRKSDGFADSDGGIDDASKPTEGNDGSSSTLLGSSNHNAIPTLPDNLPPLNRPSSLISKKIPRVSFNDKGSAHSVFTASEVPLPASAQSSTVSFEVPPTTHVDSSVAIQNQPDQLGHNRSPKTSTIRLSDRTSIDNSITAPSSRRSDASISAYQLSLPASVASSNITGDLYHDPQAGPELPLGGSLEDLQQRLNYIPRPARKKRHNALLHYIAGPARTKKKPQKSSAPQVHIEEPIPEAAPETEDYRAFIEELASHFPTFQNVATVESRHEWSSRVVFYDCPRDLEGSICRYEPWPLEDDSEIPSFAQFKGILTDVSEECAQRLILVEDLTPALIDLLGATFQIPPHVFEEHLERSGYRGVVDRRDDATAWHTRPSAHGYSSITWYRPVLPLVPITPGFHAKIIGDNALPQVRCPIEDCQVHDLWLGTVANIWRNKLDLCTDPGVYYKNSQTRYPVGWEEKVTIWTRDDADCKFGMPPALDLNAPMHVELIIPVVILLDPLPVVTVEAEELVSAKKRRQRVIPTMANLWYRQQELAAQTRNAKRARSESQRRKHVHDWMAGTERQHQPTEDDHTHEPLTDPDPNSSERPRAQTTGVDQHDASSDFTPGPLRRRFTRPARRRQESVPPHIVKSIQTRPDQRSEEVEIGKEKKADLVMLDTHQDFVVYEPIKARASSTDTVSAYQIETYIESIRNPRSTLDEFEHFLMSGKGKNRTFDPLQALFQTIHDDTNILADIIRTSMQRIREGTLDEDFMQKRVKFWRSLLHRLGFHLGALQGGLREFEQFVFEPDARTPQNETQSQTLAKDTQRTLTGCMDLIDRSAHSLLAEMQIADSRRGIAEAESVSKLTELAFVFIPLSFVASLFSMQIHELDGGVPVYQFALVAIAIVIAAYAVRLSIRSERLLDYRDNFMRQVHEDSGLRPDEKLPTHKFIAWAGANIGSTMLKNSKNTAAVLAPIVVAMAVIAAVLSPIVLLWQRNINAGFSVAITVLIILLDGILIIPVAVNMSNAGLINFDPRDRIRRIQAAHERNRKRRQKERRRRRREAGLDPEAPYEESSLNSDIDLKRKTGSMSSSMTSV